MVEEEDYYFTTPSAIGPVVGNLPNPRCGNQHQVKVLVLNDKQYLESTIFYLQKGWEIRFQIGTTLFGKKISLFTNHPTGASPEFNSKQYHQLEWKSNGNALDISTLHVYLPLLRAGPFHYYYTECNSNEKLGSGYFIVEPVLTFSKNDVLSLDSVKCHTVLVKCLGSFVDWERRLRVSKESNYNMIHFTPIQELGGSNSSYCLKDQLKLNPAFSSENYTATFRSIQKLTRKMREEWRVLSIGDVVLNHTANESPWLQTHPECSYNMKTASYLIPAAILDGHLHVLTKEVSKGKHVYIGIPPEVFTEDHLQAVRNYLEFNLAPRLRLHEFYMTDVEKLGEEFVQMAKNNPPTTQPKSRKELILLKNEIRGRYQARVDLKLAVAIFNTHMQNVVDEDIRLKECVKNFKERLRELNEEVKNEVNHHVAAAINSCIANMRYFRLQEDGPKVKEVSTENPLVPRYFTGVFEDFDSVEREVLENGQFIMAHNGWVMNSDSLKSFADPDTNVYLRRELIVWGDNVKLRYGESYGDCPFLWDLMQNYVELTTKIFDGIRLDNCHSTPLHVAEYFLDCARRIKPDLYVAAELFTNSDLVDNIFANRLGITVMIRETLNAYNSRELGRLIHRFGGDPVGSFIKRPINPLSPSIARALFYDVTHDNPSFISKRSVFDTIPTSSLVTMACCAAGSTRGFDELVPHHIHVVSEKRLYPSWTDEIEINNSVVGINSGIISFKRILNRIHETLCEEGFNEIFVDQMNESIICITRHNPVSFESIILVSHTAFSQPDCNTCTKPDVRNLRVEGEVYTIILETKLQCKDKLNPFCPPKNFQQDKAFINGLTEYEIIMKENIQVCESDMVRMVTPQVQTASELEFQCFPPGSIIILRVRPHQKIQPALESLRNITERFLSGKFSEELINSVKQFKLSDYNHALYRCQEEASEDGTGTYDVPGFGRLVYCGLQGFESVLQEVRTRNDLGHPICENLRQGPWMLDYVTGQLKTGKTTSQLGFVLEKLLEPLRLIPKYIVPKYFDVIISTVCLLLKSSVAFKMTGFVREGSSFIRDTALGTVQCVGVTESSPLPPFSPEMSVNDEENRKVTMCAGLPHFSTGYMRSWGRDTFISLRGLLLLTGRYEEARYHILGYAACLRHGLIPNLLNRGVNARYNCRDAVWWWLYAITCYIDIVPEGHKILQEIVSRIYSTDDSPPLGPGLVNQPLHSIMQEALNVHFRGKSFRERHAGLEIDAHMTSEGFNVNIGIDMETGFVYGGNEFNCGTWMDKMGSDVPTGNKGKPATPRDGSAVELVALCKAVINKLKILKMKGIYPYEGVTKTDENGETISWSFEEWENKIRDNFEKLFWIPEKSSSLDSNPELIHRRQIYKDCVGASQPWSNYQLRPNFLIALTVAPDLVECENALKSISLAEEILLGPLGIKTLDPEDWNYNGNYNNDDDSDNVKTARGFNYHQGPEWLWPVGFLLRAKLHFAKMKGHYELDRAVLQTWSHLGNIYQEIQNSHWKGLPELTNENGKFCKDGCRVQAWSMACILEVLYDLTQVYTQ